MGMLEDQLSELQKVRDNVARLRNERGEKVAEFEDRINIAELNLVGLQNRLQVLAIHDSDNQKSAKALRGAWFGLEMPQGALDQVADIDKRATGLAEEIKSINKRISGLTDLRGDLDAECRLARKAREEAEEQLRQIDKRTAEIQGLNVIGARNPQPR